MDKESDFSNITPNQWLDKCVSDWLTGKQGPNTFNPYPSRKPSNGGKCIPEILNRDPSNMSNVFWAITDCRRQYNPGSEKQESKLSDCEKQGNKCGEGQSCKPFLRMIGRKQVGRNKINNRCSQLNNFYTVSGVCTDVNNNVVEKTEDDCNKTSGLTWSKPCNGTLCVKYSDVDDSTAKSECEANKPSPGFNFDQKIVGKFDSNDGLCNFFQKEGSVCQNNTREKTCTYYNSIPWHLNSVQVCRANTGDCEDPYALETHTNDPEHGDVCRKKDGSGEWKSPKGCIGFGKPPWSLRVTPGNENIGSTQIKPPKNPVGVVSGDTISTARGNTTKYARNTTQRECKKGSGWCDWKKREFCCPSEKSSEGVCSKRAWDWAMVPYCPLECVGMVGGLPGTCNNVRKSNNGTWSWYDEG